MEGGNTSRIVVWLDDTVIVKKPLEEKVVLLRRRCPDRAAGARRRRRAVRLAEWCRSTGKNEFRIETKTSRAQVRRGRPGPGRPPTASHDPRGITSGSSPRGRAEGRLAHLGLRSHLGTAGTRTPPTTRSRSTRSPTGRSIGPGSPCGSSSGWRHARYDQPDASDFAGKPFTVEIQNPKGEKVFTKNFTADAFGGLRRLVRAALGRRAGRLPGLHPEHGRRLVPGRGVQEARVRGERRGPDEAGDAGREGRRRRSRRSITSARPWPRPRSSTRSPAPRPTTGGIPSARWDWLFGPGYWWFAADTPWYPGWSRWGMLRPVALVVGRPPAARPRSWPRPRCRSGPTARSPSRSTPRWRRLLHPDQDHRYEITAEVTDQSRRTIVGTGTVLVARKPFTVYTWVDRGHYRDRRHDRGGRPGPDARPQAGRRQGDAQAAQGHLRRRPQARRDARGELGPRRSTPTARPARRSRPPRPGSTGSRRRSTTARDTRSRGATCSRSPGQGFDGASFRFNDLEIIPERKEYQPGETLRLLINTNQVDSTVLLFVRPIERRLPAAEGRPARTARARSRRSGSSPATCPTCSSRP